MPAYDIAVLHAPPAGGRADMQVWRADGSGRVLTGPLRVAQAWAVEFLTRRGSRPFNPNSGSSFCAMLQSGRIRNDVDARTYFLYAAGEVSDYLRSLDDGTGDPSERFDRADLVRLVFAPGSLALVVSISTVAGTGRTLTLPLPTLAAV
jgi:hypothetical protein